MNEVKFKNGFNIKNFLMVFAVVSIVAYGIFNARNLIIGPKIEVYGYAENIETEEKLFVLQGKAKNVTFLSLNERSIFANPEGFFKEELLLSPGFNIITLKAKDRFKKEIQKEIKIYYNEKEAENENLN